MLPDYETPETLDYETIAEELREEIFKTNSRLMHAEGLLRKIKKVLSRDPYCRHQMLIDNIHTLLGGE